MPAEARRRRRRDPPRAVPVRRRARTARRGAPTVLFSRLGVAGRASPRATLLAADHDVAVELWSATSYKALREDALAVERIEPAAPVTRAPRCRTSPRRWPTRQGPVVAVTDFMKAVPDQIARWVPGSLHHARHRRLRPLRHPRGAAPPLRSRRRPHRRRRAQRAAPPKATPSPKRSTRRSRSTASTPTPPTPGSPDPRRGRVWPMVRPVTFGRAGSEYVHRAKPATRMRSTPPIRWRC